MPVLVLVLLLVELLLNCFDESYLARDDVHCLSDIWFNMFILVLFIIQRQQQSLSIEVFLK